MRPPSIRFKRRIVSVAVFVAFIALYLPFEDQPWSLYAALCVSYTVLVFGLLWSDGKWRKYIEAKQRKARDLIQGHAAFLLVIILWIWVCRFFRPRLPDWMFDQIYGIPSYYLIFSGLGIVAIWWVEQGWLAKPPKKNEQMGASVQ
ncbi:MAG TPA: hypothetical protein VJX73_05590 [Terracidiphilus sp.]|nr:hypothetical protein [Terracidiphilus sp.]